MFTSIREWINKIWHIDKQNTISKPGMVAHAYNPNTWEAETGGSQVRSQPWQLSKTLNNFGRTCFKIKNKTGMGV